MLIFYRSHCAAPPPHRRKLNPLAIAAGMLLTLLTIFSSDLYAQCHVQDFSSVLTASSAGPGVWYPDRYRPAGFEVATFDDGARLKHSISAADCESCRPSGRNTTFYNTQGRKYNLSRGTNKVEVDLYIPAEWASADRRMAGLWGTAFGSDHVFTSASYPIVEFSSLEGTPKFRGYESGDASWVDIGTGLPAGFAYNEWVTLSIELLPSGQYRYTVSRVAGGASVSTETTTHANTTAYIGEAILQGHNTADGVTYDIYWDNLAADNGRLVTNTDTEKSYCGIQEAIDDASTLNGHTLVATAGIYDEIITIHKSLTLLGARQGEDPRPVAGSTRTPGATDETVIQGASSGKVVLIDAPDVTIDGFHIRHDGALNGDDQNLVETPSGAPVRSGLTFRNNILTHSNGDGINVRAFSNVTVHNNYLNDLQQDGISISSDPSGTGHVIKDNEISASRSEHGGVYVYGLNDITIEGNIISDSKGGIRVTRSSGDPVTNAKIYRNEVTGTFASGSGSQWGITVQGPVSGESFTENIDIRYNRIVQTGGSATSALALFNTYGNVRNLNFNNNYLERETGTAYIRFGNYSSTPAYSPADPVNASCNWFGSTDNAVVAGYIINAGSHIVAPYLVNGTDTDEGATGFVPGASACGPVKNITQNKDYVTIQSAVDEADANDIIEVSAGNYTEVITINKSLTLRGPNVAIPGTGTRVEEAVLLNSSLSVTGSSTVLIAGFHALRTDSWSGSYFSLGAAAVVTVENNIFERDGVGIASSSAVMGIITSAGTGAKVIRGNLFTGTVDEEGFSSTANKTLNGIYVNGNNSDVTIEDNTFGELRTALNLDDYGDHIKITGNHFGYNRLHIAIGGNTVPAGQYVLAPNNFENPASYFILLDKVASTFRLDLTSSTFEGSSFASQPLAVLFDLEAKTWHRGRDGSLGLVYYVANSQYAVPGGATIQSAVDYAPATLPGDLITIQNGTYSERLVVTRAVKLLGESRDGVVLQGAGKLVASNNYGIELEADGIELSQLTIKEFNIGILADNTHNIDGLNINHVTVNDNRIGFYAEARETPRINVLKNVNIVSSDFSQNFHKGLYLERASDFLIDDVTIDGSGTEDPPAYGLGLNNLNGIDFNLKFGDYENIIIRNSGILNSGVVSDAADASSAIAVKARDDGSYAAAPATLTGVTIENNTISGPNNGIRIGEYGKVNAGPSNVVIKNNDLSASFAHKAVVNNTNSDVTLECNWFGTADFAEVNDKLLSGQNSASGANVLVNIATDDSHSTCIAAPCNITVSNTGGDVTYEGPEVPAGTLKFSTPEYPGATYLWLACTSGNQTEASCNTSDGFTPAAGNTFEVTRGFDQIGMRGVRVVRTMGGVSETCYFTLKVTPLITESAITPCSVTLTRNGSVSGSGTTQWYRDNAAIDGATGASYAAVASGTYKAVVTISGVEYESAGHAVALTGDFPVFTFTAATGSGSNELEDGENVTFNEDEPVALTLSGDAADHFELRLEGNLLASGAIGSGQSLNFNAGLGDAGTYTLSVTKSGGCTTVATYTIQVNQGEFYVNDDATAGDVFTLAAGNDANPGTKQLPFRTITHALGVVPEGGTVIVDAGTYVEDVVITRSVRLRGSNFEVDPNTGTRHAEAVIYPATTNVAYNNLVLFTGGDKSDVEVSGFTLDGDNPGVADGTALEGADVNAEHGIYNTDKSTNVLIKNNIIRNLKTYGVFLYNYNTGNGATSGNLVTQNKIDNIGSVGVLTYNNAYTSIIANSISRVGVGIQTGNFHRSDPGNSRSVSSNTIQARRRGIWHNLIYSDASVFEIGNNNISHYDNTGTDERFDGIMISSLSNNAGVSVVDNTITGTEGSDDVQVGYQLWNNPTSNTVTIQGGTVSRVTYGVWANNYEGYPSDPKAKASSYVIDGVAIEDSETGIYVKDNADNDLADPYVRLTLTNGTSISNPAGHGILVEGVDARVTAEGAEIVFGPATGYGIRITGSEGAAEPNFVITSGLSADRNGNSSGEILSAGTGSVVEIASAWTVPAGADDKSVNIDGSLLFEDGVLNATAGAVRFLANAVAPHGSAAREKASSHILGKAIMAERAVGSGALDFLGIDLEAGADLGNVSLVRTTSATAVTPAFPGSGNSIYVVWDINTSVANGRSVAFSFLSPFLNGQTLENVRAYKLVGSSWTNQTSDAVGLTLSGDLYSSGTFAASGFSTWTLSSNPTTTLPVRLSSFAAVEREGAAYVSWSTTEEVNFDRFEVQRSLDGSATFRTIGTVSPKGSGGKGGSYSFTDHEAPEGQLVYYRLNMVDLDGTAELSRIESLELSGVSASVYPNPANSFVKVSANEGIRSLELVNMSGQRLGKTLFDGKSKVEALQLYRMPSGVYQVRIEGVSGTLVFRKVVVGK